MKLHPRSLVALLALASTALFAAEKSPDKSKNCGCSCCEGKEVCCCNEKKSDATPSAPAAAAEKPADTAAAVRHPLRGVIVDVRPAQSSLLVKHEAIPGYMRGMTMLFKVDEATLQAAQKGQAITATLVERDDAFWLEDVKPAK